MALTIHGKRCDPFLQGTAMLDALARPEAFDLLDAVAEAGATSFDLANNYGHGLNERIFGAWAAQNGDPERWFIVTKGGHPEEGRARVTPADVRSDLEQSLASIGVDAIDLYLLHRDDESVPVDEIVDFLEAFRSEGLIRAYGGSNWRLPRIEAAQDYARRNGFAGFSASSPNFSLAIPKAAPWPGCVSLGGQGEAAARAYYQRTGMPVLAWSSLAMGYFALQSEPSESKAFTNRAAGDAKPAAKGALPYQVFETTENRGRKARALRLAADEGCSATEIAFRYVLNQPFDVYPITGCRSGDEYVSLRRASERPLAPATVRWLESGDADREGD